MLKKVACLFSVLLAPCTFDVAVADIIDQSNLVPNASFRIAIADVQSVAQTFEVGVTGVLSRIDLQISKNTLAEGDLLFSIRNTLAGIPDPLESNSLFQTTITLDSIPEINGGSGPTPVTSIDVSSAAIAVFDGEIFSYSLSRSGGPFGSPPWATSATNNGVYSNGSIYTRPGTVAAWSPASTGDDLGFQTHVTASTVPEPGSFVVLSLIGVSCCVRRCRQTRNFAKASNV
ncbi:hypothetical protein Fuma_01733 [Fuerstiella marisgermanici]|uniref:PEP-CTERM protein-sorting domain-containing protein n=1 Tax=Fuerstiella marisgermanici TaxID=1891926 RepID=A0A1P8WDH1_9PLAN|nr:hypothetical protein Fuma_01733 [Fuerstiella marisgermanici]